MSRREQITEILTNKFSVLYEFAGHERVSGLIEESVEAILELSRPRKEVIHCIGPNGSHRLQVDGQSTGWVAPNELARNGDYIAATDFFAGQLPQVGKVSEVERGHYKTTAQQNLRLDIIKYSEIH